MSVSPEYNVHNNCLHQRDRDFPFAVGHCVRCISVGWQGVYGSCLHERDMGFLYLRLLCAARMCSIGSQAQVKVPNDSSGSGCHPQSYISMVSLH